jgi:hypothetical protein
MKTKHLIIVLSLLCCRVSVAQENKLFEKYADMDHVTSVYISKAMFQMMPNIENAGMNLMSLKGKVESLQLVTTEKKEQIPQMRKDFSQLVKSQMQELMRIRSDNTNVTFYSDTKEDEIQQLLMLADTDSSYTVIRLIGHFKLKDIQELTQSK